MQRTPVESSTIAAVGFADGVMEIEFNSGTVYSYTSGIEGKMQELHDAMIASDSIGRYFHAHIKMNMDVETIRVNG